MTGADDRSQAALRVLDQADALRANLAHGFRDDLVQATYDEAQAIATRAVRQVKARGWNLDVPVDRLVTSRVFGLPLMVALLGVVFWLTVAGANVPSALLMDALLVVEGWGSRLFESWSMPWWVTGFVWHGVYRAVAWVIGVMLPPMAIFFPCFTILEDLGYLPRVAFNMDWLFRKAGAHGKQSLTMSMGFGCNAAGVIACRVIDSPRERLIAILTNNFVPCNGRFPTLIMVAGVFVAAGYSSGMKSVVAAGTVVGVVLIGVFFTLVVSAILSRTVLKGEASAFTLELPPYRRPDILRVLYTSIIDRTVFVLARAIAVAAPAGAVIWILGNVDVSGLPLSRHVADFLEPLGRTIGLDGVIMLAYVIAIPANEIVVPTMLMVYMGGKVMTEDVTGTSLESLLVDENGWTMLTAVNLMLFSLLHNPCATTILTMWKETRSYRWTALGALMPLALAFAVTFIVAKVAQICGWA